MQRTKDQISEIMRRVKSRDTTPELKFRKALWARGIRYRLHETTLAGKPDVVVPSARLAIFVDGDFWHGNQWRQRGLTSFQSQFVASPRADYWVKKIDGNMERDRKNTARLLKDGWRTLRFWESDIEADVDRCVDITIEAIESGNGQGEPASGITERTAVEFFAGIGLMRLGLEAHGWTVCFANDIDPEKFEMYRHNFPGHDQHFHSGDIHALASNKVPSVTLATASFPCIDLSSAGNMKGIRGEHSSAFGGFIDTCPLKLWSHGWYDN